MENGNKLIPNSFQHPNLYVDKLAYFLTPAENVVLTKAIREILGWHDKIEARQARIALSVFVDGKFRDDGTRLCYGCGLGIGAVRTALKVLDRYGVLVKVGSATHNGQMFRLPDSETDIDWEGLEERRVRRDARHAKQTEAATEAKQGEVALGGGDGVSSNDMFEVSSDDRGGVSSDDNKETHLETQETQGVDANASTASRPLAQGGRTKPKRKTPSPLEPDTWQARDAFARLGANAAAKGRRGPARFPTLECKQKFDSAAGVLDGQFKALLVRALEEGCTSITRITNWLHKCAENQRQQERPAVLRVSR